jgi:hypothetical protein
MDIGTIFNLDCLFQAGHESPEFSLDIILGDGSRTIEDRVERHLVLKIPFLEVRCLLLELFEGVDSTFLEAEIAVANETSRTMPIVVGLVCDLRIQAIHVIAMIA